MTALMLGRPRKPSFSLSRRGTTMNVPVPVGSGCSVALKLITASDDGASLTAVNRDAGAREQARLA